MLIGLKSGGRVVARYLPDWIKEIVRVTVTVALHCALEQDTLSDC